MAKKRQLLAAGLVQDYRFQNETEFEIHIYALKHNEVQFKVLEKVTEKKGAILARIITETKGVPLIELYED